MALLGLGVEASTVSENVLIAGLGIREGGLGGVGVAPVKQHEVLRVVVVVSVVAIGLRVIVVILTVVMRWFLRRRLPEGVGGGAGVGGGGGDVDPLPRVGVVHRRDTDAHPRFITPSKVLLEEGMPAALNALQRLPPRGGGLVAGGLKFFDPLVPPGAA